MPQSHNKTYFRTKCLDKTSRFSQERFSLLFNIHMPRMGGMKMEDSKVPTINIITGTFFSQLLLALPVI